MRKLKWLLVGGLLALTLTSSFAEIWVEEVNGVVPLPWREPGWAQILDVASDADGNVYVTGELHGATTLGDSALMPEFPSGTRDALVTNAFVAKLDRAGNWLWAEQVSGDYSLPTGQCSVSQAWCTEIADCPGGETCDPATPGPAQPRGSPYGSNSRGIGIAVDSAGDVYLTGQFNGTARFGAVLLRSVDGTGSVDLNTPNVFAAKLDGEGEWLWAAQSAAGPGPFSSDDNKGLAVAVDSLGNSYVAGHVNGTNAWFGPNTRTIGDNAGGFIAQLNPDGIWNWVVFPASGLTASVNDVAVDATDNLYLVTTRSGEGGCLERLNTGGSQLWEACIESGTSPYAMEQVAVDSSGQIYVAGALDVPLTFLGQDGGSTADDVTISPVAATPDLSLVKYAADGNPLWGNTVNLEPARVVSQAYVSLVASSTGYVYLAGSTWQDGSPGYGYLQTFKLTSAGSQVWSSPALDLSGSDPRYLGGIALSFETGIEETVYVGGRITQASTFAAGPASGDETIDLEPDQDGDGFLGKLNGSSGWWNSQRRLLTVAITEEDGDPYTLRQGEAVPPAGETWFLLDVTVDAIVPATEDLLYDPNNPVPGSEDLFASWVGTGSVPSSGAVNEVSFVMEESSTLTWVYSPLAVQPLVGRPIPRPNCAAAELPPPENIVAHGLPEEQSPFYRSEADQQLYTFRPVVATISWPRSAEPQCSDADDPILVNYNLSWPEDRQLHIAGTPANIQPADGNHEYLAMPYSEVTGASDDLGVFQAERAGYSVLQYAYTQTEDYDPNQHPVRFEVVQTVVIPDIEGETGTRQVDLAGCTGCPVWHENVPWVIGQPIVPTGGMIHEDTVNGYVLLENAAYDGGAAGAAHDRATRVGPIVPVNETIDGIHDDLVVVWYRQSGQIPGVYWGYEPVQYGSLVLDPGSPLLDPNSPVAGSPSPGLIVISSEQGTGGLDPALHPSMRIYNQPEPGQPGFNPNDEHALYAAANDGSEHNALFALRNDLQAGMITNLATSRGIDPVPTLTLPPFVLMKYLDAASQQWVFRAYEVAPPLDFQKGAEAGSPLQMPYPLSRLASCDETAADENGIPFWADYHGDVWARAAGLMDVFYWYPLQSGLYFTGLDLDGNGQQTETIGDCVPWLDRLPGGTPGTPIPVTYDAAWPADVPVLHVGETLLRARSGLPEILNQPAAEIAYDELNPDNLAYRDPIDDPNDPYAPSLARLFDPMSPRSIALAALPAEIETHTNEQGKHVPVELPFHLRTRFHWDPVSEALVFKGYLDEEGAGEPLVLLNVMTVDEKDDLLGLCLDLDTPCSEPGLTDYTSAVEDLFDLTRNPLQLDLDAVMGADEKLLIGWQDEINASWDPNNPVGDPDSDGIPEPFRLVGLPGALTAGAADGNGYLTLAFNNDPSLEPLPVSLNIIYVDCEPYQGEIQVVESDNVFDERLTLRHSGDFGAEPEKFYFEWWRASDTAYACLPDLVWDPNNPSCPPWGNAPFQKGPGLNFITIEGANETTLTDNYFIVRYRAMDDLGDPLDYAYEICSEQCSVSQAWCTENADCPGVETCDPVTPVVWAGAPGSPPAAPNPMLAEGWVKRVVRALNPFEDRAKAFHVSPTNTYASMLVQLGERYEGDIAFSNDPAYLNSIGLIEAYETVLRRALELGAGLDIAAVNDQILLAAGRIADFYMLLGNEGMADALDPTIGLGTDSSLGSLAPAVFSFQNQLDSLLEEELVLLRGRDDSRPTGPWARPVYNRIYWNFTSGSGEVAYAQSYNVTDQNGDGVIDEDDAQILYPQGHGDAWGHYLMAIKNYYRLLQRTDFTWVPRTEDVLLAGVPVEIDYLDERKFAKAASAKARTGAEIVDLTYRMNFVEDPAAQWQGYKDTDEERAWGVDGWSRRAGQGAYLDWVVGNAILPAGVPGACSIALTECFSDADCPLTETCDPPPPGTCECLPPPDSTGPLDCPTADIACGSNTDCTGTDEVCREPAWIERIDRNTVAELDEVGVEFGRVQAHVDRADAGLNPLGLARGVVPFDIDPAEIAAGKTHFEQIQDRALTALGNTALVFDHANQLSQSLRRHQDTVNDFARNIDEQEQDYTNRLIEIYGYPYEDDKGPDGAFPSEYDGPDLAHWMYVDDTALTGTDTGPTETIVVSFPDTVELPNPACEVASPPSWCSSSYTDPPMPAWLEDLQDHLVEAGQITYEVALDGTGVVKPEQWTGRRRAPGELQMALSDLYQARARYWNGLREYENLILRIEDMAELLEARFNLHAYEIHILNANMGDQRDLSNEIKRNRIKLYRWERYSTIARNLFGAVATFLDVEDIDNTKEPFLWANLSSWALASRIAGELVAWLFGFGAEANILAENENLNDKEQYQHITDITLEVEGHEFESLQEIKDLEQVIRQEPGAAMELAMLQGVIQQSLGNLQAKLAEGQRLQAELWSFRKAAAADTQVHRYRDMAFRIFRNDAIQKYRAQFDLAARYAYLATTAYDYETSLLSDAGAAGRNFLTDIVRHRNLGQVVNGTPVAGSTGLADPLARMDQNFQVLKGQLGFNNPQDEANRFSLRAELFRIPEEAQVAGSDQAWRDVLASYRVDNLWDVPEYRRYARPFAPEPILDPNNPLFDPNDPNNPAYRQQPGLVIGLDADGQPLAIPMRTTVTAGLSFFERLLGGGDSSYDPSHFATKIRSVGVWFRDYDAIGLTNTPRVYLIPVGMDVLRSPNATDFTTREWRVLDQKLPVPFPVNAGDMADPDWTPLHDELSDDLAAIRRFSAFRAYHDSGGFTSSELTTDTRLIGRSVWNTRWLLIIPGDALLNPPDTGLDEFIGDGADPGVSDILLYFQTYAYSGN